ncbi:MAG: hypothetical protein ACXWV0_06065 [Flavisolibacter sp.]
MSRFYLIIFSSTLLISCYSMKVAYLGSSLPPTRQVDIYVDPSAIKRPYTVIGKGYPEYSLYGRPDAELMQEKAIEKAKSKGADAILFQDVYLVNDGSSVSGRSGTDSLGRGAVSLGHASPVPVVTPSRHILFLKYNQ